MKQDVIICRNPEEELATAIGRICHDRIFVFTDRTTLELCWPLIKHIRSLADIQMITIEPTDEHKTLDSLVHVWSALQQQHATRHSLMINLGGGMVTDLGGFAASTFKRGIHYINIPTTLLSMVDASVGGKTGINFGGLKNEIGVFNCADTVLLDTRYLKTLDYPNLCSGFAEMLKHGLISDSAHWADLLCYDLSQPDWEKMKGLIGESVQIKKRIVEEDPTEQGIRKALNLGHTVGHALESMALADKRPVLHGYAVAWGLVCELYLSVLKTGFPTDILRQTVQFIREHYGHITFSCKNYEQLYTYMTHDKKNEGDRINFTLMKDIGDICINQQATREEIYESFDFYCENMG